jgi:hypothetical protein
MYKIILSLLGGFITTGRLSHWRILSTAIVNIQRPYNI